MKIKFLLIIGTCLLLKSCTPAEVQIAEEIAHEAVVAEEAVEADLSGHPCNQDSKPASNIPAQQK